MNDINELIHIDFSYVFISICVILIVAKTLWSIIEYIFIEKLGIETKGMKRRKEEHDLLIKTAKNLTELQEQYKKVAEDSVISNKQIKDELHTFISQTKKSFSETQQVQKKLNDTIREITDYNFAKDKQIDNLMVSQREILADRINQKYKYYISIKGIPEDEVDEFTSLHDAYKGVGGNHSGDAKYEYCINHLDVIPVKTNLMID